MDVYKYMCVLCVHVLLVWGSAHSQTRNGLAIDTIRNGYETLTRSNAKYSRHHVTMWHIVYEKIACILVDVNSMVTSMVSTL